MNERNCLSYWFPKLVGVPVPYTGVMHWEKSLLPLLDGKEPDDFNTLVGMLRDGAKRVGPYPVFLRTGQGSGKHQWKQTCFLQSADDIPAHIAALVEWSACVDFLGLPTDVWVVREMLPTRPVAVLPMYGDMPLVPEVRCFVGGGKVKCWHSYWPEDAIRQGFPPRGGDAWGETVYDVPDNFAEIVAAAHDLKEVQFMPLAQKVAELFADDGEWSVDLLPTAKGWFVTDMAEAERSFHYPGCAEADNGAGQG